MAVGSLLQTYLSRFGVSIEGMSGETIGFAAAFDAVAATFLLRTMLTRADGIDADIDLA